MIPINLNITVLFEKKILEFISLYGPVRNTFDKGNSITESGRGVGPGNRDFFGPCEMASCR